MIPVQSLSLRSRWKRPHGKNRSETFRVQFERRSTEGNEVAGNITREELKAKIDRGEKFVLVDALSQGHYESSHLPGAINLPYEFVDEAEEILLDKNADISFPKHKTSYLWVSRLSDR
jgi:hypothetical protein